MTQYQTAPEQGLIDDRRQFLLKFPGENEEEFSFDQVMSFNLDEEWGQQNYHGSWGYSRSKAFYLFSRKPRAPKYGFLDVLCREQLFFIKLQSD